MGKFAVTLIYVFLVLFVFVFFSFLNKFLYLVHRSSVVPNYITLNDQVGYFFLYNIHQIYSNGKKRKQNETFHFLQRKNHQFGFDYANYLDQWKVLKCGQNAMAR